ncbi:MAG: serine/threonine protein kinase [Acidobacteriota bacterium]|nr:serine/threonine protein kinase [Acidobacteriota bacterium]
MKTFGKYQILEEIGSGAAGVTYLARDPFRNREFALKVLNAAPAADSARKEKLCRDLAAAAELQHSHIAAICDLGEVDDSIYIATELLAGDGLDRHFRDRRDLPLPQKLKLMAQAAEALTFAHSMGTAHGNLKPSNIFVVAKYARILDFGLASAVSGSFPNYLAPEQVLGRPFDARSDVFSCAVILYELLGGAYPFQAQPGLIPRQIVHAEPEPLRNLDPRVPEELEQLLAHALKKNPEQRLETADEFASALYTIARDFQNGRPSRPASKPVQTAPAAAPEVPEPAAPVPDPPPPATEPRPSGSVPPPPSVTYIAVHPPVPVAAPVAPPVSVSAAPPPPAPRSKFRRARVIVYAAAAVLTISISVSLLSRQSIRASQSTAHPPAAEPIHIAPPVNRTPAATARPTTSPTATDTLDPKPPVDPALFSQVKSLWELGRYGQATEIVNTILLRDPANAEARAWRKKIRAAQQAEAGMK